MSYSVPLCPIVSYSVGVPGVPCPGDSSCPCLLSHVMCASIRRSPESVCCITKVQIIRKLSPNKHRQASRLKSPRHSIKLEWTILERKEETHLYSPKYWHLSWNSKTYLVKKRHSVELGTYLILLTFNRFNCGWIPNMTIQKEININ